MGNNSFMNLSIEMIVKYVCRNMKVSERQIIGKSRTMDVALARQLAMFLAKELTNASLANIGSNIGGRDHSTVIHACKNIDKKIQNNNEFQRKVESMKNEILGQKTSNL
jgi:chromosomal replication initiator protein